MRQNFANVDHTLTEPAAVAAVPEPGTIVMLLGGVAGLRDDAWRRRRRRWPKSPEFAVRRNPRIAGLRALRPIA
ncbi:MAG: hypothetical protein HQ567_04765 [Candidatus Nealsonbacteria bacterium]|nr:hypothetical protein [Candidatus Nealsonbacteria bacterium]